MNWKHTTLVVGVFGLASPFNFSAVAAEEAVEEIIVTGSYIRGSSQDAASPVQVITREDMDIQSAVTIDDVTKNLTINSGTTTNHNYDTENATISGTANINLRGLGLNSTLVLLNGKRQVVAAGETQDGSEFVDINTIPMVMLERIEVLKDGGSALYGSDAIAGVVNFIVRDEFEGLELTGDVTHSDRGGADDFRVSGVWGTAFNDGKTHFVFGAEYFDREPTSFLDLGLNDSEDRSTIANSTLTAIVPGIDIPFLTPPGGFSPINLAYLNQEVSAIRQAPHFTDPLCSQQGYFTGLYSDPANAPGAACREDQRPYRGIQLEQQRVSVMGTFSHAFNDNIEFYALGNYYEQDLKRPVSGSFGSIDSLQAILPVGDPFWGLGSRATSVLLGGPLPTPANAPISQSNGGPNSLTYMGYQLDKHGSFEFHPSTSDSNTDSWGGHIGLKGDFEALNRSMTFDVSVAHSQNHVYREELTVNRTALELAQNGLGGPNCVPNGRDDFNVNTDPFLAGIGFTFTNPAPGYVLNMRKNVSLALTSTNQGVGDCKFLNPFLTKETTLPNDPEVIDHIYRVIPLADRRNELTTFDAVLTSELFDMGGGAAQGAIGYQHRDSRNRGKSYPMAQPGVEDFLTYETVNPDGSVTPATFLQISDDHFYGIATQAFDDDRNINAVFGELNLPFTQDLEMQIALRWEDYGGNIGDNVSPKVALRWQALESVALRGSFSQSFRAPNTGVLFKGVGFDGAVATDPLAKDEVRSGFLPISDENSEVVVLIQNGAASPLLGPEEADAWNIGVIFEPGFAEGLRVSLDYYNFEFSDKVVNAPLSNTIDLEQENFEAAAQDPNNYINQNTFQPCVKGSSTFCVVNPTAYATQGIQRSPQGDLQVVDFFSINAGSIDTSGLDLLATYVLDSSFGIWTFALDWNHVIEFVPSNIPGFEDGILGTGVTDGAGTTGDGSIIRSMPDNKGNFTLNFTRGNHSATGIVRYIDGYDNLGAQVFNSGSNPPKTVFDEKIKSWTTLDVQYNFRWQWGDAGPLSMTIGMINATDEDPPKRDDTNQGYDSTTFDPRGRRYYLRLQQTF